jgi:hypothetical protein
MIIGVEANKPATLPPTPSSAAPPSSSPALLPIAGTTRAFLTPTTSSPQPVSSAPARASYIPSQNFCTSHSAAKPPVPTSSAQQPRSSELTLSTSARQSNLSTSFSSAPASTPSLRDAFSSSRPVPRTLRHYYQSIHSRTALGPLSQNIPSSSPQKSPVRSSPSLSIFTGGTGTCKWTANACPLSIYIFILGPCILKSSYVNEDLLGRHGCRYITSLRALSHPSLQDPCPQTGKRLKKIALVETREKEPTVDFLKRIRRLNLMRKGQKRMG